MPQFMLLPHCPAGTIARGGTFRQKMSLGSADEQIMLRCRKHRLPCLTKPETAESTERNGCRKLAERARRTPHLRRDNRDRGGRAYSLGRDQLDLTARSHGRKDQHRGSSRDSAYDFREWPPARPRVATRSPRGTKGGALAAAGLRSGTGRRHHSACGCGEGPLVRRTHEERRGCATDGRGRAFASEIGASGGSAGNRT
jgi:hypothetical protein